MEGTDSSGGAARSAEETGGWRDATRSAARDNV